MYTLQISHAELDFIVTKAEQWRGEEGERRKTAIYDYVWEEEVFYNLSIILCIRTETTDCPKKYIVNLHGN